MKTYKELEQELIEAQATETAARVAWDNAPAGQAVITAQQAADNCPDPCHKVLRDATLNNHGTSLSGAWADAYGRRCDIENDLNLIKTTVCAECETHDTESWHIKVKPHKILCADCFGETLVPLLSGGVVRKLIKFLKG